MKLVSPRKVTGMIGCLLLANHAIGAGELPGSAMPEQVSKALTQQGPTSTVVSPQVVAPEQKAPNALSEQAKKIRFKLNGVKLIGNHVYSEAQLLPIYQSKLNHEISVLDLMNIVQDITNFYRNNGYILSRAILPPQHAKFGVVTIQIIEGYINNVEVSGQPHNAKCLVLRMGHHISELHPLEISRMEKYLILMNEIPATSVKAVLAPSKNVPGAADLSLVTVNNPVTGYLSYDNYGTRFIGPQQMTANIAGNSLFNSGDSLQLTATKTPRGKELTYGDINYNGPICDNGIRWLLGATRVHTHPLFVLAPQDIDGVNSNYYTSVQYPLIRTRSKTLTVQAGFNYLDSNVEDFGSQLLYNDHIRSISAGGTFNFADSWYGSNLITMDLRHGLPIWGYSRDTSLNATTSRPGGTARYTKFDLLMSRLQGIKGPLSVYLLAKGQWSFSPLLSSEQFSYGGSQLGRGYDVAEILGDMGAAGTLEPRYDLDTGNFILQHLQFYGFYDVGAVWNRKFTGTPSKLTAMSFGVGTRFSFTHFISGNIMWTKPLTRQVLAQAEESQVVVGGHTDNRGNGRAPRVFFSIVGQFD